MKLNEEEKKLLSEAIDKMNEGLDTFIGFYNDSEEDKGIIEFTEDTIETIEKAISFYGKEEVTAKINTIVKEVLSFIPNQKGDS
ncbi:atypical membrane-integrating protein (Mistic protein) [Metabacillus niabensis]|uniref:atypical membrane-integrating protein (Mistic protein) n=1 Tax=Metabacillus niabensis TaxID=324854 RepID=UPI001CFB4162|nr:atypical membrane-integrating protein (Mistic protein) [Metabacillus niabensis]